MRNKLKLLIFSFLMSSVKLNKALLIAHLKIQLESLIASLNKKFELLLARANWKSVPRNIDDSLPFTYTCGWVGWQCWRRRSRSRSGPKTLETAAGARVSHSCKILIVIFNLFLRTFVDDTAPFLCRQVQVWLPHAGADGLEGR